MQSTKIPIDGFPFFELLCIVISKTPSWTCNYLLLLCFYYYCIDIFISNLRKQILSRKFVWNEPSLWDYHGKWWCYHFLILLFDNWWCHVKQFWRETDSSKMVICMFGDLIHILSTVKFTEFYTTFNCYLNWLQIKTLDRSTFCTITSNS